MAKEYTKERVLAFLSDNKVSYDVQEHGAVHTMADVDSAGVQRKGIVLKNLFLKDGKGRKHFLVSVPEDVQIDFGMLGGRLGVRKMGLASAERLERYLGVEQGCVSPMGILNDEERAVVVVFDSDLPEDTVVGIHPNDTTASVWMKFGDVARIVEEHGNEVVRLDFSGQEV